MTLSRRLTYNVLAQNAGKLLTVFLNLALVAYLSRYLGVRGMGEYATVLRFIGFAGVIADLGLNVIIAREISLHPDREREIVNNGFTLRFFTSLMILLLGAVIAQFFPYDPIIKKGIFLVLPAFWFTLLHQIFIGLFQKHLRMDRVIFAEIVSRMFLVLGTIWLISLKPSLTAFFHLLNLGNFLWFLMIFLLLYRLVPVRFQWNMELQKKLLLSAAPLALINIFHLVYFNIDSLMLSVMHGTFEVGIYHIAYKVVEILFTLMVAFVTLFIPILTGHFRTDIKKFRQTFQKLFDNTAVLSVTLGVFGIFFAQEIVEIIGGNAFLDAVRPLQILFVACVFMFFNVLWKHVFIVLDKQRKVIWLYALGALLNVVANFVVIPRYSYTGAAITTMTSEAVIVIFSLILMKKYYRRYRKNVMWSVIAANMILAAGLYSIQDLHVIWKSGIAIAGFLLLVKIFRLPLALKYD